MSISRKIKTIDNKLEQKNAHYDLDRQTGKIFALSSGNISKYKFLISKDALPEKAATMRRFEYFPSGKKLKSITNIAKKQYQRYTFVFDEIIFKK